VKKRKWGGIGDIGRERRGRESVTKKIRSISERSFLTCCFTFIL